LASGTGMLDASLITTTSGENRQRLYTHGKGWGGGGLHCGNLKGEDWWVTQEWVRGGMSRGLTRGTGRSITQGERGLGERGVP
jgi:hypothetical protein